MTFRGDPYLALGLPPTASAADVKRAYRVLAKRHHPDASKGSVARFLEIQAAYEMLVRPDRSGVGRPVAPQPTGRRPTAPGTRSSGPRRAAGERPTSPPRASGESGSGQAAGRGRRRRNPRTATLGSTTYDETVDVAEPAWDGADWYGPTSGTYWTVNPKEYADPRKHGPEYLARSAGASPAGQPSTAGTPSAAGPGPTAAPRRAAARSHVPAPPAAAHDPRTSRPTWPGRARRLAAGVLGWLPFGARVVRWRRARVEQQADRAAWRTTR